jgi:acetyl esterase/lipase
MKFPILFMLLTVITFGAFAQIRKKKDITYIEGSKSERQQLDVYYPKDTKKKKDVFVFFHGGSWRSGKKDTYKFLGKRMARKGFVTVIANYTLAPKADYHMMVDDASRAVQWVHTNIEKYGGDSTKITVSGHSAGGHLAALITVDDSFKKLGMKNPVYKTVLIDAFGLDMKTYFEKYDNDYSKNLLRVFTKNPEEWKAGSPIYHIDSSVKTPFLVLRGSKTYPAIFESSEDFYNKVIASRGEATFKTVKGKKHIAMIVQLFFSWNETYDTMTDFIRPEKIKK